MKKVFAEMGLGNETFFSSEVEEGEDEYRIPKFVRPQRVIGYYFRFWLGKTVFIFDTSEGFKVTKKDRVKIKILFGISGVSDI